MKKFSALLFLVLVIIINADAQVITNRDSISSLLRQDKQDTARVVHLNQLSYTYFLSKPDSTLILAMEALQLSRKIGFKIGEARSLSMVSTAYNGIGNLPKAMEFLLKALKMNEKINKQGVGTNYHNIGRIFYQMGNYQEALNYYKKATLTLKQLNKKPLIITLVAIGATFYELNILDSAQIYAQQANNVAKQTNNARVIGISSQVLGGIHAKTGENKLALEYYRLGIVQSKKVNDLETQAEAYIGMAEVFNKIKQRDSSIFYGREAIKVAKARGSLLQIMQVSSFLSSVYSKDKMTDSALHYLEMFKTVNDSLFSQQKQAQFQSLVFDEKLRQQELLNEVLKAKEDRKVNLQYAAIATALVIFVIAFVMLSHSIVVRPGFIKFFSVLGLLGVFEFINLFIHPYLEQITHHSPILMLLILIGIGALLIPLHHKLEKWITSTMVEKNNAIRLAAAKKTIELLGSE